MRSHIELEVWIVFQHFFASLEEAQPSLDLLACYFFPRSRISLKAERSSEGRYLLGQLEILDAPIVSFIFQSACYLGHLQFDWKSLLWVDWFDLEIFS